MSYICKYTDKKYEKIVTQSRQIQLNQVLNNQRFLPVTKNLMQ